MALTFGAGSESDPEKIGGTSVDAATAEAGFERDPEKIGGTYVDAAMAEAGFECDPEKNRENVKKHGFPLDEAASVFRDPLALDMPDPTHSDAEDRRLIIGETERGRLIVVWYTERGENTRIIGSRKPTPRERKDYENGR